MAFKVTMTAERKDRQDTQTLIQNISLLLTAPCLKQVIWSQPNVRGAEESRRANDYFVSYASDPLIMISSLPPFCHPTFPLPLFILLVLYSFQFWSSFIFPCFPFFQPPFSKSCKEFHDSKSEWLLSHVPLMVLLHYFCLSSATPCRWFLNWRIYKNQTWFLIASCLLSCNRDAMCRQCSNFKIKLHVSYNFYR